MAFGGLDSRPPFLMKVAIVHDWLTGMRGGEKCLEVFCRLYPEADLFTLLHIPGSVSPVIENRKIYTSFLQSLPGVRTHYRYYLPLMPWAVEQFQLQGYDLVLSSSHCVAKGVRVPRESLHVCYCYTPMRYIWDQFEHYFGGRNAGRASSAAMRLLAPSLRSWDVRTSRRVDRFVAISRHVQKRIRQYYDRPSDVIHPPVDDRFYTPDEAVQPGDYFLIVSAFAPYKRIDLAVDAFNKLGYPLVIIGEGQDRDYLRKMAGSHIRLPGWVPDAEVRTYYARCRAFLFCGEEDFGITPLEAQAMGRPVVALARGGALETVIPDRGTWNAETGIPEKRTAQPTGVFFQEQTPEALLSAVRHFETIEDRFDPKAIRRHALQFGTDRFARRIQHFLEQQIEHHRC